MVNSERRAFKRGRLETVKRTAVSVFAAAAIFVTQLPERNNAAPAPVVFTQI